MTQHQTKAFTLVELIVVITILAILGTIAFISLQGYSKSARDSTRVSDVNTIESSLELFALQSGYYPEPSDTTDVVFSGAQVWTQGTVGDGVSSLVQRLNKKPVDPLTGTEYTYSRLNTKGEIEIAAVLELGDITQVSNTYAGDKLGSAYVEGNYNGAVAKVSTGSNLYVLAVPTIISGDISLTDYTSLIDQGELVFNGGEVLPASYDGSTFKTDTTSITGISTGNIVIYNSGSSLPTNQSELNTFITNLQTVYSGSSVADSGNIAAIVGETDTNNLTVLAETMVENMGSENIEVTLVTYTCDTNPGYTNTSYTIGSPNQANESWQNTNNANACYYECTGGYTGNDCSIAPDVVTQTDCTTAGWYRVAGASDMYIGTLRGEGFCISPRIGDFGDSTQQGISWNGWGDSNINGGTYLGWDGSSISDTGNPAPGYGQTRNLDSPVSYSCKELGSALSDFDTIDTIYGRMKWLVTNKVSLIELQDIEWIQNATPPNGHPIPALYIADCIDGVKDLTTTMSYTHNNDVVSNITYADYSTNVLVSTADNGVSNVTYQNRQKYLTAWTQKSGSHLPSAFSYISNGYSSASDSDGDYLTGNDRGEYQIACEANLLIDGSDSADVEIIWSAAIGNPDGKDWGRTARWNGYYSCNDQHDGATGVRDGVRSARFVIRP